MAKLEQRPPRELSMIRETFVEPSDGPPYVVYADSRITRRKRHHMICDGRDSVVFRSRWWSDVIDWLANEGESYYTIITDRNRYTATTVRYDRKKET